jgi:hypothetical protein
VNGHITKMTKADAKARSMSSDILGDFAGFSFDRSIKY